MLLSDLTLLSATVLPLVAGQLGQRQAGPARISPRHNVKRADVASVPVFMDAAFQIHRVNITVGTPPQTVTVGLESWTSDLTLFDLSSKIDPSIGAANVAPTYYSSNQSSTFSTNNKTIGNHGMTANETIALGGQSTTQTLLINHNPKSAYGKYYMAGSLGLGRSGDVDSKSLLETMSSKWDEPVCGLHLGQMSAMKGDYSFGGQGMTRPFRMGELTLGGLNKSLYTGDVSYFDLANTSIWSAPLDAIKIGDETLEPKFTDGAKLNMMPLFGSSILVTTMPQSVVDALYAKVPGSRQRVYDTCGGLDECTGPKYTVHEIPCNTSQAMTFTFGGIDVTANATEWVSRGTFTMLGNGTMDVVTTCIGEVMSSNYTGHLKEGDEELNQFRLSNVFLQSVYMAFKYGDKPQLGFAKLAPGLPVLDGDCMAVTYGGEVNEGKATDFTNCTYDPNADFSAPPADDKSKDKNSAATGLKTGVAATLAAVLLATLAGSSVL